ncbi:MAG: phosphatase PAP2 family protein [Acidobacteriota bacterium]|nr:phosphatase PAP2 family protein [Acidobacteriota bacterium]
MSLLRFAACSLFAVALAAPAFAQDTTPAESAHVESPGAGQLPRLGQPLPPEMILPRTTEVKSGNFFKLVGSDFKNFFGTDTAHVMAYTSVAAIGAAPWDREGVNNGFGIPTTVFQSGNLMGSFAFQLGVGAAGYAVGRVSGNGKLAMVGRDVVRAQLLSQGIAQASKFAIGRERPDGSNSQSFPSGHAASAFATASVLHRHYGWKAGVPAYAFGSYVALARMSWNKHHATDVVMGAGLGIASARTVTMSVADTKFNLGVQPQVGGASVNFTKLYR